MFRFRKREDSDRPPIMKITFMTTATRDEALLETSCLRHTDFREIRVRPSLPQAIRDNRDVLYYGASHSVSNTDKVARCVYNARKELFELRYFDTSRNIDRVDWSTTVEYTDADYSAWKAAVTLTVALRRLSMAARCTLRTRAAYEINPLPLNFY